MVYIRCKVNRIFQMACKIIYRMPSSRMITNMQSRAARGLLHWTQEDLAKEAGVSALTISKFEAGLTTPVPSTLAVLKIAFEKAGVEFLDGDGVRLRRPR
jgi:DNA-binding XRE family transcriptional regulator